MNNNIETTIKSDKVYEGKIINLRVDSVELPDRKYSKREIVEHDGTVAIVVIKGRELLLLNHYRKAINKELLEIPAGIIDKGETPLEAASRELEEETGIIEPNPEFVMALYSSPGYSTEKINFFYVIDPKNIGEQKENLDFAYYDIEKIGQMIDDLDITDMKTVIAYNIAKDLIK
ncbi:MAG: NUDIX hydrolase [Ezakiella sp.]|nr:NUDIX hydrolase [Ezakiella sp.]